MDLNQNYILQNIKTNDLVKIDKIIHINEEKKNNNCNYMNCSKRLCLLDIEMKCKCGGIYCKTHRYYKNHNCCFDYKKESDNLLKKNMEKITIEKINKI